MPDHKDSRRAAFVVAGIVLPLVALWLSWSAVRRVASAVGSDLGAGGGVVAGLVVGALLVLVGHALRVARTKVVLDSVRRGTFGGQAQALAVGYLFGFALPLRLGELARAYIASRKLRISLLYTVLAIAVERLLDVVLVAGAFLVWMAVEHRQASTGGVLGAAAALAVAVGLLVLFVLLVREDRRVIRAAWVTTSWLNPTLESRARFTIWSVIFGFQRFLTERARVVRYAVLTAASWVSYLAATAVLQHALLAALSGAGRVTATTAPYAVASPALGPGVPGPFLRSLASALASDVAGSPARLAGYAASAWAVLNAPLLLIGLVCLLLLVRPWRKPSAQAPLRGSWVNKLERDEDISGALPSFLDAYFQRNHLSRVLHKLEVSGDVTLMRFFKGGSNAVTVLAAAGDEVFVKKIVPTEHAHRLKNQHDWLAARADLDQLVTVLREEVADDHYAIDLEYRPDSVPLFEYVHTRTLGEAKARLDEVWGWMDEHIYRTGDLGVHAAERDAYVEQRFLRRVLAAADEHAELAAAMASERIVVNGVEMDNLDAVMTRIRDHERAWADLARYRTSSSIHGDLTIDNILVDTSRGSAGEALVIDPSDDNEIRGPIIDFARHLQSLRYGYEFHNDDESPVHLRRTPAGLPSIAFHDHRSARYAELDAHVTTRIMPRRLAAVEQRAVLFHVGLFYGRMLTHRVAINPDTALKYYGVCVSALNAFLDQYDPPTERSGSTSSASATSEELAVP